MHRLRGRSVKSKHESSFSNFYFTFSLFLSFAFLLNTIIKNNAFFTDTDTCSYHLTPFVHWMLILMPFLYTSSIICFIFNLKSLESHFKHQLSLHFNLQTVIALTLGFNGIPSTYSDWNSRMIQDLHKMTKTWISILLACVGVRVFILTTIKSYVTRLQVDGDAYLSILISYYLIWALVALSSIGSTLALAFFVAFFTVNWNVHIDKKRMDNLKETLLITLLIVASTYILYRYGVKGLRALEISLRGSSPVLHAIVLVAWVSVSVIDVVLGVSAMVFIMLYIHPN
eukprot:gnl/Dysnectes_brevis/5025_a7036_437.p1 GENE.gnl/Dysnectes_brevis/5025_a7036_437~~gnl/Dysnectes_brevis/5025_a7036_437.p1  ORF type:complete len:285 (+),score=26.60 gnl/Dysnectes_brevis/5025_a7036_437:562-1416(+)